MSFLNACKQVPKDQNGKNEHGLESILETHPYMHAVLHSSSTLKQVSHHLNSTLIETVPSPKLNILWQQCTGFVKSTESNPIEPPKPDTFSLPPSASKPSEQQEAFVPLIQHASQLTSTAITEQPTTASKGATSATQTMCQIVTWNPALNNTQESTLPVFCWPTVGYTPITSSHSGTCHNYWCSKQATT